MSHAHAERSGAPPTAVVLTAPLRALPSPPVAALAAERARGAAAPGPEVEAAVQALTEDTWRQRLAHDFARTRLRLGCSYARSSGDYAESIESQHAINAAAALRVGVLIPDDPGFRYGDNHVSGAKTRRPGLDRLVADGRAGAPWSEVWVKDLSRLVRVEDTRYHAYLEVMLLVECGARVRYAHGPAPVDAAADPGAALGQQVLGVVQAWGTADERRQIILRCRTGKRDRIKARHYPGGEQIPYGTVRALVDRTTGAVRVPELAFHSPAVRLPHEVVALRWADDGSVDVVKRVFAWLAEDLSLGEVARRLNAERVPAPGLRFRPRKNRKRAERWELEHVRTIAQNPLYTGDLVWGRRRAGAVSPIAAAAAASGGTEPLFYEGFMPGPAPVTREQFAAVGRVLERNRDAGRRRARASERYLLSGRFRCRRCGRGLSGRYRPPGPGAKRAYRYYVHNEAREGAAAPCVHDRRSVNADLVEAFAVARIRDVLGREAVAAHVRAALADLENAGPGAHAREAGAVRAEVAERRKLLKAAKASLNAAKTETAMSTFADVVESHAAALEAAEIRLASVARADEEVARARARVAAHLDAGPAPGAVAAFDRAGPAGRQQIARHVVLGVDVDFDAGVLEFVLDPVLAGPIDDGTAEAVRPDPVPDPVPGGAGGTPTNPAAGVGLGPRPA